MNLEEALKKTEESVQAVSARLGELYELLEQTRKQRDNEMAVLQALRFAKQQADKPEPVAEVETREG
jgi:hypothetical protein